MRELDHYLDSATEPQELRDLMGENYSPRYQRLLHYIPDEQIIELSSQPLGKGKFGAVWSATWRRPPSLENNEPMSLPVVLKSISSDAMLSEKSSLQKFFREVCERMSTKVR
jgi:hypothetical protein